MIDKRQSNGIRAGHTPHPTHTQPMHYSAIHYMSSPQSFTEHESDGLFRDQIVGTNGRMLSPLLRHPPGRPQNLSIPKLPSFKRNQYPFAPNSSEEMKNNNGVKPASTSPFTTEEQLVKLFLSGPVPDLQYPSISPCSDVETPALRDEVDEAAAYESERDRNLCRICDEEQMKRLVLSVAMWPLLEENDTLDLSEYASLSGPDL